MSPRQTSCARYDEFETMNPETDRLRPDTVLPLPKFSIGVGDRFGREAAAQLTACRMAAERGVAVIPVWNKSNREHKIVGSAPSSVRAAADAAVRELGWREPYFVDADHISLETVDPFADPCDFFTIDVADAIGKPVPDSEAQAFCDAHPELFDGAAPESGAEVPSLSRQQALETARLFLGAVRQAAQVYRRIVQLRQGRPFVTEVSMDETSEPQTPAQLLVILAALADERVPLQTIAPKFTGRFNKGVDYQGDVGQFEREFRGGVAVLSYAVKRYGLPGNLKLSVHSGSDKFSIYPAIRRVLLDSGAGVHLKTAGTTWLEELIGLAEAGGEGLTIAKEIYRGAWEHREELCAPYAAVIDIDPERLPSPQEVDSWSGERFASALRHNPANPGYNPHLRQLLHVGYKIAALMGDRYLEALERYREPVARNVTQNLFERHIAPVFLGA